ncbi:hypothetical protein TCAL_11062 [Tigriopus californicus]|uniref:Beta-lactamase-related domain-containing protein n=1 Tax=Tigriopus californicus TaxID=6832 RepID=A0A553PLD9_TIGCA|nr:beta-lactamase domain-containing protein 2-like [Tigriopus californicus]TRY78501.1 hypothetical protein TCAL_11062 [Tigriopus californicus]|eukprot:TCALIF_11062-PA protein Name:"Similar to lact-2 Beta-lactamase domain-containing protein 2 (Caenorhabditis elegans)" AED:0.00 eAED:0.00 QI:1893/1/1/1/1/1/3/22/438
MGKFFVQGTVEPGFEPVKELFARNIQNGTESNAQLCVYHRGRKVVDLWGSACGDPKFGPESLVNVFSATKSVSSICMAALVDRGLLKYEDKVSQHWPAFGKQGKENITVADVLRHEAGLPTLSKSLRREHISRKCIKANVIGQVIEETRPHFPPKSFGSVREYHAVTRGWILNEIFRRVEPKGRTIGEYLRAEISGPLGIDVYIGVEEDELKRFSSLQTWHWSKVMAQSMIPEMFGRKIEPNMATIVLKAFKVVSTSRELERTQPTRQPVVEGMEKIKNPANIFPNFNTKEVRMGEIPSANGSCTARGLAKLAQCILNGGEFNSVRILSTSVVERMQDKPVKRKDFAFSGVQNYFSQGGVNHFVTFDDDTKQQKQTKKLREGYVGWFGMGGSVFQWNPRDEIAFAFVPTLMHWYDVANIRGARYQHLINKCVKSMTVS